MREGCSGEARWRPQVIVPAVSDKKGKHPAVLLFGVELCKEHASECTVDVLVPEARKKSVEAELAAAGKDEPDWSRASVRLVDRLAGRPPEDVRLIKLARALPHAPPRNGSL